nr:zinc finger BED domain-containing protein RICESLEEPER 2-like [Ipomoea batatas]
MSTENSSIPQNTYTSSNAVGENIETNIEVNEQAGAFEKIGLHSNDHDTQQNEETVSQQDFQTNKRKKTSCVWDDFTVIEPDGIKKAKCNHCHQQFTLTKSGTTSSLKRHQAKCVTRKTNLKMIDQQMKLNFLPSEGVSSSIPPLHPGKFDMELMRESATHWIMMHEHPFTILEEVGFNIMMKRGSSMAFESQVSHQSSTHTWDDFDAYCAQVETAEPKRSELLPHRTSDIQQHIGQQQAVGHLEQTRPCSPGTVADHSYPRSRHPPDRVRHLLSVAKPAKDRPAAGPCFPPVSSRIAVRRYPAPRQQSDRTQQQHHSKQTWCYQTRRPWPSGTRVAAIAVAIALVPDLDLKFEVQIYRRTAIVVSNLERPLPSLIWNGHGRPSSIFGTRVASTAVVAALVLDGYGCPRQDGHGRRA